MPSAPPAGSQPRAPSPPPPSDRAAFVLGFIRTPAGNLTQLLGGTRLTVFAKWGRAHFLVDDGSPSGPRYSPRPGYDSEQEAVEALWLLLQPAALPQ